MVHAYWESAWWFEQWTFYIGSLGDQTHFSTSWHAKMLKWVWPSMNRYKKVSCTNLHTISKHAPELTKFEEMCMQNNQLPTKTVIELKNNSSVQKDFGWNRSRFKCFQVQPVTCWYLSDCLSQLNKVYSIKNSLKILTICIKYWPWTNYFSNSSGPSVPNSQTSLLIVFNIEQSQLPYI